jgi:hypothetical protein
VAQIRKFDPAFLKYVLTASVIVLIISFYPVYLYLSPAQAVSVLCGYFLSLINVIIGYALISNAIDKKTKSFMIIVFGGMGVRILVIAAVLLILLYVAHLEPVSLVSSVFFFYFLFMSIEIKFLYSRTSNSKLNQTQ